MRPEAKVLRDVTKYLKTVPGLWFVKIAGGPRQRRGLPDLHITWLGRSIWIELKAPGEDATPLQESTLRKIRAAGGMAEVVRSADELKELLEPLEKRIALPQPQNRRVHPHRRFDRTEGDRGAWREGQDSRGGTAERAGGERGEATMTAAELCRKMGFVVGDVLQRSRRDRVVYGSIQITAIGLTKVLIRAAVSDSWTGEVVASNTDIQKKHKIDTAPLDDTPPKWEWDKSICG